MNVSEAAYRVPFRVQRRPPVFSFINTSPERVDGVTLTLHGTGLMAANVPATLRPGEALAVTVVGQHTARNSILVIRWFRPDGVEDLWRVSL